MKRILLDVDGVVAEFTHHLCQKIGLKCEEPDPNTFQQWDFIRAHLTKEQRLMVESARKEPKKYTEGVILSAGQQMLFRNVPPPLAIALAMTEGYEKAERRQLMDEHQCSEMEAAVHVARRIGSQNLLAPTDKKAKAANA